jgi:hypothetical protein
MTLSVLMSSLALAGGDEIRRQVGVSTLRATSAVSVQVDIVWSSTKAGTVDPSLSAMQATLGKKVRYESLKKLSTQTLQLEQKTQSISLPNGSSAALALDSLKAGVATIRVKVPPAEAMYTLANGKSLYLQAGQHDGGDLWLVLSQPK